MVKNGPSVWDLIFVCGFACMFSGVLVLAGWAWALLSMGMLLMLLAVVGAAFAGRDK